MQIVNSTCPKCQYTAEQVAISNGDGTCKCIKCGHISPMWYDMSRPEIRLKRIKEIIDNTPTGIYPADLSPDIDKEIAYINSMGIVVQDEILAILFLFYYELLLRKQGKMLPGMPL